MLVSITEARRLVEAAMASVGHSAEESEIIADHLMDCELRGLGWGGLARGLSVIDRINAADAPRRPIRIVQETPVSATFDGGDQVGYIVGRRVTDLAVTKAKVGGVAVVGAHETWYTGMFSYYLEAIARAGFVGMVAGSGGHVVAPQGGTQARFGTNPIAFGFPSSTTPVIWDIGTAGAMLGEVVMKARLGEALPDGLAYDREGAPTRDPGAALLGGAINVWGGHKGSGLALVVQLLGMMCGAASAPDGLRDCGFFVLVIDPGLLTSADDFKRRVSEYADSLRATRPLDPAKPVRVPFDRSEAERAKRITAGAIEVNDEVFASLSKAAAP